MVAAAEAVAAALQAEREKAAAAEERVRAAEATAAALAERLARAEAAVEETAAAAAPPAGAPTVSSPPAAVEAARTTRREADGLFDGAPAESVPPTEEEVYQYAEWLGMELPAEEAWLWIAYDGLVGARQLPLACGGLDVVVPYPLAHARLPHCVARLL